MINTQISGTSLLTFIRNIKYKKTLLVVLVLLALFAAYQYFGGGTVKQEGYTVELGPLEQIVEFSGTVSPQSRVDLAFERAGRVSYASVDVGDFVPRGKALAGISAGDVFATLERERATLEAEEAALAQLERGAREEELAVERAKVTQFEAALAEARPALITALSGGFASAGSAIHATADNLFNNPNTDPQLKHNVANSALMFLLEGTRTELGNMLDEWQVYTNDTSRAQESYDNLIVVQNFLENLAQYANGLTPYTSLTTTTIETWKTNIATARTSVNTAITTLNTARAKFSSAQESLSVSERQLALLEAGATSEDIAAQAARVSAQKARVRAQEAELGKYTLYSPISGTITARNIEPGELVSANTKALSIDSAGNFEIDARVSELDVVVLRAGMEAEVTVDAYGDDAVFPATISRVDPAETQENGTAGYGVTLSFSEKDERLKAGMTANATIRILLKESVFVLPVGFIEYAEDGTYAHVENGTDTVRTEITLGEIAPGGLAEVISGLADGDTVLKPTTE